MTQRTNGMPELKYSEEVFRDMYEALTMAKDALRTLLYEHPGDDIGKAQMEVIDKALAKARGGK